ncbi:MAG: ATP-binding protein [Chloroflexi bacterium]|nr:ATP-binding protein [Chloroflexota bacterium]MCI0728549.1 ATP-binding protein [Chloroflexota bacterium]
MAFGEAVNTFGALLAKYRRQCTDLLRGGMLTQERLAELLEQEAKVAGYSPVRVSNWERGQETIRHDNRELLVGLVYVFHRCGGLYSLDEANGLLFAGGYRQLDEVEIQRVAPGWLEQLAGGQHQEADRPAARQAGKAVHLYPPDCGEAGVDLGAQRLLVSATFGAYFAGLLERRHNYVELPGQIAVPAPPHLAQLAPISRIFWALQEAKGQRLVVIAAEGGMGKSTLAARVVRCLYQEQAIEMILGDSAKNQQANIVTGAVTSIEPGYYDPASFYRRLYAQLGLPAGRAEGREKQRLADIADRLAGRRAVIVVDNLETLERGSELLAALKSLTGRDIRAIVTTRTVSGLDTLSADTLVVHLQPIQELDQARTFLAWHIDRYQGEHPGLARLKPELEEPKRLQRLLERTGGIPLLMQLVLSDVARYSWEYVELLPALFGQALLGFLYQARWQDLGQAGQEGAASRQLLQWMAGEQYGGRKISMERLAAWATGQGTAGYLSEALRLLHERFLIVNHDPALGNFTLFPSLVEFLRHE